MVGRKPVEELAVDRVDDALEAVHVRRRAQLPVVKWHKEMILYTHTFVCVGPYVDNFTAPSVLAG